MRGSPRATCDAAKSAIPTPRGRRQPGRPPRRRPRRRRSARLGPRPNNGDTAREPTIACLWVEHLALLFLALENPDRPLEQRDRGLANGSLLRFPCQSGRRGHPEGQRDALPVCIGRLVFEDELGRHAGRGRNREFCLGIHRSTVRPRRPVRLSLTSGAASLHAARPGRRPFQRQTERSRCLLSRGAGADRHSDAESDSPSRISRIRPSTPHRFRTPVPSFTSKPSIRCRYMTVPRHL